MTSSVLQSPLDRPPRSRLRFLPSALRTRLVGEGIWVLLGQVATASAALVGVRLLTEFTLPRVFGEVNLWLGVLVLGRDLFCTPLIQATLRFYSEVAQAGELGCLRRLVGRLILRSTGLLAAFGLLVGAAYCAWRGSSFLIFIALAGLLAVDVAKNVELAFLQAARRQRPSSIWLGCEAWARPLTAIAFAFLFGATTQVILLGYLTGSVVVLAGFRAVLPREGVGHGASSSSMERRLAGEIWRYSWPLSLQAVVGWINTLSDRFIVGLLVGANQVGFYVASLAPVSAPFLMVQGVIGTTIRPLFYASVSSHNRHLETKIFRWWLVATAGICTLGVLLVYLGQDWIVFLLLAKQYRGGAHLMPLIASGYAFFAVAQMWGERLFAYKRTDLVVLAYSLSAVISPLLAVVLIRQSGLFGAAMACSGSFLSLLIIVAVLAQRVAGQAATRPAATGVAESTQPG